MTSPQDPEATSVITWGRAGDTAKNPRGRHHVNAEVAADVRNGLVPPAAVATDHGDGDDGGDYHGGDQHGNDHHGVDDGRDEVLPAVTGEAVTCPECGTAAHVTLNRREALDFCRTCDYPLFWAPQKILRGAGDQNDESLRRLPGQSGRVSIASLPCPFCAEQNALDALRCIRCGRDMHPVQATPAPAPRVYVAPPTPEPEEPELGTPAWVWWTMAIMVTIGVLTLLVLIATGTVQF